AIGDVANAYVQNEKVIPAYRRKVQEGVPPTLRGVGLSDEDRIRREIIMSIMCNWRVDKAGLEKRWGFDFAEKFGPELEELREEERRGFVQQDDTEIRVVDTGRIFVRNIAMIFDERLRRMEREGPVFSRTV
ncbi:MAG: coproporphyrinogen III oxidase, partial [Gemmatimonadetes bacterium]|nr:coproporphyrinogen III oxidase [Gemmatimonadota bacterium]